MIRVRVRGIAATALTKILLDHGYRIVQASSIIRERFGLKEDYGAADVTVKDAGYDELLVLGFYGKADEVYRVLTDSLEYVFKWVSPVGLHSIYKGRVKSREDDKCIVDLGGVEGILYNCRHSEGSEVLVGVEKPCIKPYEKPRLTYRLRIVGEYVSLIHGSPSITISEHIRDRGKRDYLVAIATASSFGYSLRNPFEITNL